MAWQSFDSKNWDWVDTCGGADPEAACRTAVAVQTGTGVTVYGSRSEKDVTQFEANENGVVDVAAIAKHHDANFIIGAQRVAENYLNPEAATALFNVASGYEFQMGHGSDQKLVFTAGSAEDGLPGRDPQTGSFLHESHQQGANIDLRYMGIDGRSLFGPGAAVLGDIDRNTAIMNLFAEHSLNFSATLTGDPQRYGLAPISNRLQQIHRTHMHFQRHYPALR